MKMLPDNLSNILSTECAKNAYFLTGQKELYVWNLYDTLISDQTMCTSHNDTHQNSRAYKQYNQQQQ